MTSNSNEKIKDPLRTLKDKVLLIRFKKGNEAQKQTDWYDEHFAGKKADGKYFIKAGDRKGKVGEEDLALLKRCAADRRCILLLAIHYDPDDRNRGIDRCFVSAVRPSTKKSESGKLVGVEIKVVGEGRELNRDPDAPVWENILNLVSYPTYEEASKKEGYAVVIRDRALATAVSSLVADPVSVQATCNDAEGKRGESLWAERENWSRTRDYNRIVQSRAFRRMVDKAQIYGSEQGVLYRTRMTHTLIVARIARQIARKVNDRISEEQMPVAQIDELLTETIALAHDLGHTPFGHQGERTLNSKLEQHCGKVLGGGFKHNYQSVRVMSYLEESYPSFVGMNVSWKVLEGALHHTKTRKKVGKKGENDPGKTKPVCNFFELDPMYCRNSDWFYQVLHEPLEESDDGAFIPSCTCEGEIVAIADEIAQRSHDIDDGIMSGRIDCNQFVGGLSRFGYGTYAEQMRAVLDEVESEMARGRIYADELDVKRSVLSEKVIDLLVDDAVKSSGVDGNDHLEIDNSERGRAFMGYLERVVNRQVLSSQTVASFDINAESIVGGLYDRLLANPFLLSPEALRRFYIMQVAAGMEDVLDFSNCDFDARLGEMKRIRGMECIAVSAGEDRRAKLVERVRGRAWDDEDVQDAYLLKWIYLNRVIADYIGDMTDAMAKEEYRRICQYS